MNKKAGNFCVDSKGYCFLCLNKIALKQFPPDKLDHSFDISSVYSLQDISRYLKVDMRKVFIQGGPIPPHLLAKVEKSNLKVELCEECASKTESISKLCRQLEKLKMEIEIGLESIHGKILEADETGRTENFRAAVGSDLDSGIGDWMEILDVLRMETMQKCNKISKSSSPRLRIQKLSKTEIQRRTSRVPKIEAELIPRHISNSVLEPNNIKMEELDCAMDWSQADAEDNYVENSFANDMGSDGEYSPVVNGEGGTHHAQMTNNEEIRKVEITSEDIPQKKWIINRETGNYNCQLCKKEYASTWAVRRHYNILHSNVRFKCKICGKEFTQKTDYNIHNQSVHMGVRFQCKVCQKLFSQKRALMAHQRKSRCAIKIDQNVN